MRKELLQYLAGLCQAAAAALMASAVIMPDMREESLWGCVAAMIVGAFLVCLKAKER